MCMDSGQRRAQAEAERQRQEEEDRQGRIREGRTAIVDTFTPYDDDFYNLRTQSYIDYAMPQLENQFIEANRELTAALARNGLLQSSIRGKKTKDLLDQKNLASRSVADKGIDFSNQTKAAIESAIGDLLAQNQSLADPTLAATTAANRAAAATQIPAYSPLAQVFASGAEGLATQLQLEQRKKARYNTGLSELFSPQNSSRIVG